MTRKTAAELQEGDRFTWGEVEWTAQGWDKKSGELCLKGLQIGRYVWFNSSNSIYLNACFPNGIPVTPKPEPKPAPAPCPFCGSNRARMTSVLPETWVECIDCQGGGPPKSNGNEAIAAWNKAVRP